MFPVLIMHRFSQKSRDAFITQPVRAGFRLVQEFFVFSKPEPLTLAQIGFRVRLPFHAVFGFDFRRLLRQMQQNRLW